ncbi:MAG: hypothetical protein JXA71_09560, partial [Chitinispirillaceae bacterium]|nr:hypothetical protein [Chitinispirillaceae bacterium]
VRDTAPRDFAFSTDPYEYEFEKPAIDILTGSETFRNAVLSGVSLDELRSIWQRDRAPFVERFPALCHYPEEHS